MSASDEMNKEILSDQLTACQEQLRAAQEECRELEQENLSFSQLNCYGDMEAALHSANEQLAKYREAEAELPKEPERRSMSFDGFKSICNFISEGDYDALRTACVALKVNKDTAMELLGEQKSALVKAEWAATEQRVRAEKAEVTLADDRMLARVHYDSRETTELALIAQRDGAIARALKAESENARIVAAHRGLMQAVEAERNEALRRAACWQKLSQITHNDLTLAMKQALAQVNAALAAEGEKHD